MMKLYGSRCEFTSVLLLAAGCFYLAQGIDGLNEFRRCYNTSIEMHCFDLQYDNSNNRWLTDSFDSARQRCTALKSTLIVIKDEETNTIVQNYISDPTNPIRFQYIWTDAYRINDYNNSYTWHWLNSKLPNISTSELSTRDNKSWYVAALKFDTTTVQFHLTDQQPHFLNRYVCQYAVSKCSSTGSNVLHVADRCYMSFNASVSWYEARNRCLKDGGDLASFENITSIEFNSWLVSYSDVRFWIGLIFKWYIWKDSGDVKFSKWLVNFQDWDSPCLIVCSNCTPSYSWLPKDCTIKESIYVVCHSVTSMQATTLTTTLPVTTSASITTETVNSSSDNRGQKDKLEGLSHIALGVGVGVGVGVPVVIAMFVIVIYVVRRRQSKTPATLKTTRQEQREEASPTEVETCKNEVPEINHYATIPRLSPPSSSTLVKEPISEAQYAILDFEERTRRKNGNEESPLSVL